MPSKERYQDKIRFKEFGHSDKENKNISNIKNSKNNNKYSKSTKRNHNIKDMGRYGNIKRRESLNGAEIMFRDIYNAYNNKKYSSKL